MKNSANNQIEKLSPRELEVAEVLCMGYSYKEIADRLCVSIDTIHTHCRNIRKKLGARCSVDVVRTFILSLDNPKQYFSSIGFLIIQFLIITTSFTMDVNRIPRYQSRTYRCIRRTI